MPEGVFYSQCFVDPTFLYFNCPPGPPLTACGRYFIAGRGFWPFSVYSPGLKSGAHGCCIEFSNPNSDGLDYLVPVRKLALVPRPSEKVTGEASQRGVSGEIRRFGTTKPGAFAAGRGAEWGFRTGTIYLTNPRFTFPIFDRENAEVSGYAGLAA